MGVSLDDDHTEQTRQAVPVLGGTASGLDRRSKPFFLFPELWGHGFKIRGLKDLPDFDLVLAARNNEYGWGNPGSTFKLYADRQAADLRLARGNEIATPEPSDGSSHGPSLCSAGGSRACHQRACIADVDDKV